MTYRPLSPGKTERTGSSRDRVHEFASDLSLDTPFTPTPPFPCYTPTVCAPALPSTSILPRDVVDNQDYNVVDDSGDQIIADN